LPHSDPDVPVKAGTYFLLRWLSSLPEPVVGDASLNQFLDMEMDMLEGTRAALRSMEDLARNVLLYTAALLAHLKANQNMSSDFKGPLLRVASALTQQRAVEGNKLLARLVEEMGKSGTFPPTESVMDKLLQ